MDRPFSAQKCRRHGVSVWLALTTGVGNRALWNRSDSIRGARLRPYNRTDLSSRSSRTLTLRFSSTVVLQACGSHPFDDRPRDDTSRTGAAVRGDRVGAGIAICEAQSWTTPLPAHPRIIPASLLLLRQIGPRCQRHDASKGGLLGRDNSTRRHEVLIAALSLGPTKANDMCTCPNL